MNAQELILRYRISLKLDEHGQPTGVVPLAGGVD